VEHPDQHDRSAADPHRAHEDRQGREDRGAGRAPGDPADVHDRRRGGPGRVPALAGGRIRHRRDALSWRDLLMSAWLSLFAERGDSPAILENERELSYAALADSITATAAELARQGIGPQSVVILNADFSIAGISALFALIHLRAILLPMVTITSNAFETARAECGAGFLCRVEPELTVERLGEGELPALYGKLEERNAAGLVLLSSGS